MHRLLQHASVILDDCRINHDVCKPLWYTTYKGEGFWRNILLPNSFTRSMDGNWKVAETALGPDCNCFPPTLVFLRQTFRSLQPFLGSCTGCLDAISLDPTLSRLWSIARPVSLVWWISAVDNFPTLIMVVTQRILQDYSYCPHCFCEY